MNRVWIDCFDINPKSAFRNLKSAILMGPLLLALSLLSAVLLAPCPPTHAQQSDKIPRIGYLSGSFPTVTFGIRSVQRELRNLGYHEGKNIAFEYRYAEDKPERSPALADGFV